MLDPLKLGSSTFKTHNGQKCHVGYIRLSDWSKFEIRRSDWLAPNRCHILLLCFVLGKNALFLVSQMLGAGGGEGVGGRVNPP